MIRTRSYYAELVLRKLAGFEIGRDQKVDERDVWARLDQLVNKYAKLDYFENIKAFGEHGAGELFVATFENVAISNEGLYGFDYADLPARYVQLPKGKGVKYIAPMAETDRPFIPLTESEFASVKKSIGKSIQGRIGYKLQGQRAIFTSNEVYQLYGKDGLLVREVIADASAIAKDAEYPIPPDYEGQIIDEAYAYFAGANSEDIVNDGRDGR